MEYYFAIITMGFKPIATFLTLFTTCRRGVDQRSVVGVSQTMQMH
jgi:hypothetical protein